MAAKLTPDRVCMSLCQACSLFQLFSHGLRSEVVVSNSINTTMYLVRVVQTLVSGNLKET